MSGAAVTEIDRGLNRLAFQMTAEGSNILPGVRHGGFPHKRDLVQQAVRSVAEAF